jgi:hypothetical protein
MNGHPLTSLEITFNRIFAVALVLTTIPFFLNILTIPTITLFWIFGIFLFFSKKYHLSANIIFFIFAAGVYLAPLPIGWGWFQQLKELRLNGFNFNIPPVFFTAPLIYISFSVRNILGNIQTFFKNSFTHRNAFYLISLIIVLATLLAYPLLDPVRLRNQSLGAQGGGDLGTIVLWQTLTFIDQYHKEDGFMARFDSSTKKYIYRLHLVKPLDQDIQFTKIETDGDKINFLTDIRVTCLGCQKGVGTPYGLVFPAGKNIDFIITSDKLIKIIKFTETQDKADEFVFWK